MSLRLDRFTTLYLISPFLHLVSARKPSIPILMYHSITDEDESSAHPYYRTNTSLEVFAAQLKYLHESGYKTCSLQEAIRQLEEHPSATVKLVVITFDDGYSDFYRKAFPALSRYHFSATVFLPTAYIGTSPIQFKGKDCLTWSEVRELRNHGIGFGSHTVNHPQLSSLNAVAMKGEILNSKLVLEDNLGEAVDSFAYPYAFPEENTSFVRTLREMLVNAGYRQGVSTRIGIVRSREDRYFLCRLPINSLDDIPLFDAKLKGGYNWMHSLQYASKFIKAARAQSRR